MPRKKSVSTLTTKQMKRTKPINSELLKPIEPLTPAQESLWEQYAIGKNLVAYGCAGTGKTFCLLYQALKEVLTESTPYEKIYIVRSLVPTRVQERSHRSNHLTKWTLQTGRIAFRSTLLVYRI